jgi:flagellar protein FliO/FliZ
MSTSPSKLTCAVAACLTALSCAATAFAAPAEDRTPLELPAAEPAQQTAAGGGGGIVRMIVGLAIVIAVIYGLSWVLKQVRAAREGQASGSGLSAVSSLPLGPNRSLHLVRVGHDLVLLGAAEKEITPIRTYREHEAVAAGLLAEDLPQLPAPSSTSPPPPRPAIAARSLVDTLRERTVRR